MKITIDNRDLAYTIDTYGMFTGDSCEESESAYYMDEYGLTESEWYDLGYEYNHAGIVKELASASINILSNAFVTHGGGMVNSIDLVETKSPSYYNYTTDSYTAVWDIDTEKLNDFAISNIKEYNKFLDENWSVLDRANNESLIVAQLDFWTQQELDVEWYNDNMFERESEAYMEHMKLDTESQQLIDSKGDK